MSENDNRGPPEETEKQTHKESSKETIGDKLFLPMVGIVLWTLILTASSLMEGCIDKVF